MVLTTWNQPFLTTGLLVLAVAAQLTFLRRPEYGRAMLIAAALGTPAEIMEVRLEEWTYYGPDLIWGIIILWGN